MRKIRTYNQVPHGTGSELLEQVLDQQDRLVTRLSSVSTLVAVASGKGGVGKSAVTANLAAALAMRGFRVGAVDADLNGPSLGRMLGVSGMSLSDRPDGVEPPEGVQGVRVMSMELLQDAEDAPLRWREPESGKFTWQSTLETSVLREFLSDVVWGELDFLLIDVPPGTDKIGRLLELLPDLDQALLVTTPSETTRFVVSKSLRLVQEAGVGAVGLVANMTEHECPQCGHRSSLFESGGAERLSAESGVPLWASIPFDPRLGAATDLGNPLVTKEPEAASSRAILALADRVDACARSGARTR
ncbi:MAG: Mrp/NBP35 family ATP-binding protein [Gemmatimonadota bacterium]|nr:MAG: Mrp/NBP35 family ATP-binding protein [Gemmatimonadota bacterium]